MSSPLSTMNPASTPTIVERREILDSLHEIHLMGFDEIDGTLSSGTTSLPTPQLGEDLALDNAELPSELFPLWEDYGDQPMQPPEAPRMKDADSFGEGSAEGSFDWLPVASTDENGDPIYPINELHLESLPPADTSSMIEDWRAHVSISTSDTSSGSDTSDIIPSPNKRPRSPASDDGKRRTRARAQSLSSASSQIPNSFEWVKDWRAPLSLMALERPPSRANTAPPD